MDSSVVVATARLPRYYLCPLSLRVFRVSFGCLWFLLLLYLMLDASTFYSDAGIFTVRDAQTLVGHHRFSFLFWCSSRVCVNLVFFTGLACAVCLTLGYHPNAAALIGWLVQVSLMNRAEPLITGDDLYAVTFLFVSAFLPLSPPADLPRKWQRNVYEIGQLMFIAQVACLYFFAGYIKYGALWKSGEALLRIYQVKLTALPLADYLLNFPSCLRMVTLATPPFEMAAAVVLLPLAVFKRFRALWVGLALLLHLSILLTMQHMFLPYICIAVLLAFLPSRFWRRLSGEKDGLRVDIKELDTVQSEWWITAIAATYGIFVVALNIHSTVKPFLPARVTETVEIFRAEQKWNFYGPSPLVSNHWWVLEARFSDGQVWRWPQMRPTSPLEEPQNPRELYSDLNWAVFFLSLAHPDYTKRLVPVFLDYLCRTATSGASDTNATSQDTQSRSQPESERQPHWPLRLSLGLFQTPVTANGPGPAFHAGTWNRRCDH